MSRIDGISPRHVAGLVVLLLVLAPFVAYTVPAAVGADESYIVLTGSMRPAIDPGAVVFVSATPAAGISVGDVITYDRGGDVPTTHRVIEVVERDGDVQFRTQGDANEDPDAALVQPEQVIGVVAFSVPYVGSVMLAANSQLGFAALVVVPFVLLLLDVGYGAVARRRNPPAADDADVPVVYDPARAAAAYYDAAEERLREAEALAGTGGVSSRDMTASMLLAAALAVYAGWNAYWQFDALGAPRAETMSVLSGALVCLAFLGYLRVTAEDGATDQPGVDHSTVAPPPVAPERGIGPTPAAQPGDGTAPPRQQHATAHRSNGHAAADPRGGPFAAVDPASHAGEEVTDAE
ncbi:signal peptidase I [Halolamina sp. CBA1230]|uniref:signal peptidase I n=1 Tax=Halolamina sp. CBA1230 TaxID=1853690 RepID=UPI0009A17708|nr:signal peptidase I [Halolamina sp. CBA1230]QKY19807.1 signal peptidase I [Halolamina sp. CBA1230]